MADFSHIDNDLCIEQPDLGYSQQMSTNQFVLSESHTRDQIFERSVNTYMNENSTISPRDSSTIIQENQQNDIQKTPNENSVHIQEQHRESRPNVTSTSVNDSNIQSIQSEASILHSAQDIQPLPSIFRPFNTAS